MRTIVYIDGFNLYYSALRGTPYKWLDVVSLFENICQQQSPDCEIVKVKFFTSPISAKLSTRREQAQHSQRIYLNALSKLYPSIFECIEGFFSIAKGTMPVYQKPIDRQDKVDVWRIEEKKTDVSMALNVYRDVVQNEAQQVVVVTADSDIIPSLEFIKQDYPDVVIGSVFPILVKEGEPINRAFNQSLIALASWTRRYITTSEVEAAQLPEKVPTKKKPFRKPSYW